MAKAKAEAVEDEGGLRSQMWRHEAFVEWCDAEYDVSLDKMSAAEVIAWFAAKRNEFRKSDFYTELVEEHRAEREEAKPKKATKKASKKVTKKAAKKAVKKAVRKTKPAEEEDEEESPFDD